MPMDAAAYTIADLARLTGLSVRTIRYYIAQGLIPASGESGPGAHYGDGHLGRLRLTKRLQQQHLPLAEIRDRLAALSDDQVAELVAVPTDDAGASRTSALEYVRGLLGHADGEPMRLAAPPPWMPPAPSAPPASSAPPHGRGPWPGRSGQAGVARHVSAGAYGGVDPAETSGLHATAEPQRRLSEAPATPPMRDASASPPSAIAGPPPELPASQRSQWERLALGPNIELHVRRPLSRPDQRRVERLITIARQVLKEDGV